MEPVFMVLGQSAALAATMAIDNGQAVQDIDVGALQALLASDPLADGSRPEILVDDKEKDHIEITGNWTKEFQGGYGPYFYSSKGNDGNNRMRFTPAIPAEGNYDVYMYYPKVEQGTSRTMVRISDGSGLREEAISHDSVDIIGQTTGEWISLGRFHLPAGEKSYVEITTEGADGIVTADAILFVPG